MIRVVPMLLAVAGVAIAVFAVSRSGQSNALLPSDDAAMTSPYEHAIVAEGIVEAASRNRRIDAPESGLVLEIMVDVGDAVRTGDPLFRIDDRSWLARRTEAQASVTVAQSQLARLRALPRQETIEILVAAQIAAQAELTDATSRLERIRAAVQQGAATADELSQAISLAAAAEARQESATARLHLEQAGAWEPDLAVAETEVAQAQAALTSTQMQIDRLTITAPCDGKILKRNIEVGESVNPGSALPAMVLGDVTRFHIRARVDEEDVQSLESGASAIVRVRGGAFPTTELTMLRIEPLAQNKSNLTGLPGERVDTRVIEVVFEVQHPEQLVLYPGMLVDVFIQAKPRP